MHSLFTDEEVKADPLKQPYSYIKSREYAKKIYRNFRVQNHKFLKFTSYTEGEEGKLLKVETAKSPMRQVELVYERPLKMMVSYLDLIKVDDKGQYLPGTLVRIRQTGQIVTLMGECEEHFRKPNSYKVLGKDTIRTNQFEVLHPIEAYEYLKKKERFLHGKYRSSLLFQEIDNLNKHADSISVVMDDEVTPVQKAIEETNLKYALRSIEYAIGRSSKKKRNEELSIAKTKIHEVLVDKNPSKFSIVRDSKDDEKIQATEYKNAIESAISELSHALYSHKSDGVKRHYVKNAKGILERVLPSDEE